MTEFVMALQRDGSLYNPMATDRIKSAWILEYAKLLQTPLSLSMFIPCDDDGEPLVKKVISVKKYKKSLKMSGDALEDLVDEYEDALGNVLFDGWWIYSRKDNRIFNGAIILQLSKKKSGIYIPNEQYTNSGTLYVKETIEDLINHHVILIPAKACKKKYGLPEKVTA